MVRGMPSDWRTKAVTIHDPSWDDDEVVTLKSFYGDQDRQAVISASLEPVRSEGGNVIMRATLDRARALRRQCAVVSWTLRYEGGEPMPCEPEVIAQLPPEVADYIDAEIERLWEGLGPRSAEQQRQEKDDHATFHGAGDLAPGGAEAGRAPHDRAGAGDPGANGAAPADATPLAGVPRGLVGAEQLPGAGAG